MDKREKYNHSIVGPYLTRKSDTVLINFLLYAMKRVSEIRKEIIYPRNSN